MFRKAKEDLKCSSALLVICKLVETFLNLSFGTQKSLRIGVMCLIVLAFVKLQKM